MRTLSNINLFRKGALLYRWIRYRGGYGVHSPFVFNLITKVIEERCPYYRLDDIALQRKQLLFRQERVAYPDRRHPGRTRCCALGDVVRRKAIRPKRGALLFRLANYFKPRHILQVGAAMGLSTLYLTSYAKGVRCVALEDNPAFAAIARQVYDQWAHDPIDLRVGDYAELLPQALADLESVDLVFFNTLSEPGGVDALLRLCLDHAHDGTILVIEGIQSNPCVRDCWRAIRSHPRVTVTLDLFSLGIVLFQKKLHKRDYRVYF